MRQVRRIRPRGEHAEPGSTGTLRWLLTYADMITLLLAFFVVMYALSRINAHKYEALVRALRAVLSGRAIPASAPQTPSRPLAGHLLAEGNAPALGLLRRLRRVLAEHHLQGEVALSSVPYGIEVVFLRGILFPNGAATLTGAAQAPLHAVDAVLRAIPNQVVVQGYANALPIHTPVYRSNWDLSSMRAARVADWWMSHGVAPTRMMVEAFGQWYPVAPERTPAGLRANRSVSVLILSRTLRLREVVLGPASR